MNKNQKQIIKVAVIATIQAIVTMLIGSGINLVASWLFSFSFADTQASAIWVLYIFISILVFIALIVSEYED